jgi:hypothetical protein
MKSFKEFASVLTEALEPEDIKKDAEKATEYLKKELESMFKGQQIICKLNTNLGLHIVAAVYSIPAGSSQLDMMNSKANAQFIMHLSNNFGKDVAMAKFVFDKNVIAVRDESGRKKIAFRKITGKTPMESAKKLVMWFKKNQETFTMKE